MVTPVASPLVRIMRASLFFLVSSLLVLSPIGAVACPGRTNISCVGLSLDGQRALPYSSDGIRHVNSPVSTDPTFQYEILDERGISLLGRVRGTSLQVERWSTNLNTWVMEFVAAGYLPKEPLPLAPKTPYPFSELPTRMVVSDFYGTRLDTLPPLATGEYRVSFTIVADFPITSTATFAVGATPSRESGIQVSPEGTRVIVTKDVGEERWVIFHYLQFGTLMGNVYFKDGRAPVFLFCNRTAKSTDDYRGTFDYECYAADSCEEAPCGTRRDWHFVANVTLPGTFFLPNGQDQSPIGGESRTLLSQDLRDEMASFGIDGLFATSNRSVAATAERQSGIQVTPQRSWSILINKDVGSDRWSLLYRPYGQRGILVGSVFNSTGAAPT